MQEYMDKAYAEGYLETLWSLVAQDLLSASDGAKYLGLPEEKFVALRPDI